MTSPCGMDCFNCSAYLANMDINLSAAISEEFHLPLKRQDAKAAETRKVPSHSGSGDGLSLN